MKRRRRIGRSDFGLLLLIIIIAVPLAIVQWIERLPPARKLELGMAPAPALPQDIGRIPLARGYVAARLRALLRRLPGAQGLAIPKDRRFGRPGRRCAGREA
jgi:hypothetical protein